MNENFSLVKAHSFFKYFMVVSSGLVYEFP